MHKSFVFKIITIFMLLVLFTGSAHAISWSDLFGYDKDTVSEKLKEIEMRKGLLAENKRVMRFINNNMFDQGVDTVVVSIKNDKKVLKTYYVVRADNRSGTASTEESIPDEVGVLWRFKPTVDQALDGLDLGSRGLSILEQKEKSKLEVAVGVMKALYLYHTVEKENVPSLTEIIHNSSCKRCKKALSWAGLSPGAPSPTPTPDPYRQKDFEDFYR